MESPRVVLYLLLSSSVMLMLLPSCAELQSSVQSSVETLVPEEVPTDPTYAGRQHFPVSPQEVADALIAIAPRHGWEVLSTGDEYGNYGKRGKFFLLAPPASTNGKKTISGIFYEEPEGTYVRVSEENGLPEPLVAPLITEIREKKGYK